MNQLPRLKDDKSFIICSRHKNCITGVLWCVSHYFVNAKHWGAGHTGAQISCRNAENHPVIHLFSRNIQYIRLLWCFLHMKIFLLQHLQVSVCNAHVGGWTMLRSQQHLNSLMYEASATWVNYLQHDLRSAGVDRSSTAFTVLPDILRASL